MVDEVKDWVSIPELANRVGTNRRTLYRWIREGRLTPRKDSSPSEFRFSEEEANRVVEQWDVTKRRLRKEESE